MELNKENIRKITAIVAFAILLNWGLKNTSFLKTILGLGIGLILPFLIGAVIAFIVNVPMRSLEKKIFDEPFKRKQAKSKTPIKPNLLYRMKRPLSLVLSLVLVIGVLMIGAFLIVPEIRNSALMVINSFKEFPQKLHLWSMDLMKWMPQVAEWLGKLNVPLDVDWKAMFTGVFGFLQNGAGNVLNTTFNVAASIFNGIVTGCLAIVFSFYLLMNKEKLSRQAKQVLYACMKESRADYLVEVARLSNRTFSKFLSGQCIEAVILGMLFFITMTILRFPYALMISVLIAFTALIPVFGAFIGCIVGAFLILMVNPIQAFWFLVLFLCLQQFEGNIIYPRVVGSSVGLPAIWVLVAVTLGGSMMGVLGMLFYIPLFSVIYSLLCTKVRKTLKQKNVPKQKYLESSN